MKMKTMALVLALFSAGYVFAFAGPPVYPGAKAIAELNDAAKKAGRDDLSYNTLDSFERVFEFYNSKGSENEKAHRVTPKTKSAMIMFKDSGYAVFISWREEDSKSKGTIIHIGKGGGAR
jgi:hypothetical protein